MFADFFFLMVRRPPRSTLFPTRRSSDLLAPHVVFGAAKILVLADDYQNFRDRKSTRLNSSHPSISYAVFCLKKKNIFSYTLDLLFVDSRSYGPSGRLINGTTSNYIPTLT